MEICLTIAGSDPSGGAGIQADLKVFQMHNCFGCSVSTLETIQNTQGVKELFIQNQEIISKQIQTLREDFSFNAIKLGALGNEIIVKTILDSAILENTAVIVDPVLVSSSGKKLFDGDAVFNYKNLIINKAKIVTPNLEEAALLSAMNVSSIDDMKRAAEKILKLGCDAVLVKGGHLQGSKCIDILLSENGFLEIENEKIETTSTHGTGCFLSASITALIAKGATTVEAVKLASERTHQAIRNAVKIGKGKGPLNFEYF